MCVKTSSEVWPGRVGQLGPSQARGWCFTSRSWETYWPMDWGWWWFIMVYYGLLWFIVVYDTICYCLLTPDPIQLSQKTWLRISMLGVFTKGLKMRGRMINSFGVSPSFFRSTSPSQDISRLLDRTKRGCQKIGQVMISNLLISKSGMAICIIASSLDFGFFRLDSDSMDYDSFVHFM